MRPFHYTTSLSNINLEYTTKRGISMQAHISDLHFGKIDPKVEFNILKEQFIDRIKDLPLDCISIDGDFFDRLFMSNTDTTLYANLFFKELYNVCKNNAKRGIHTVLILILGTKNHDADQLRLFYPYLKDKEVDLRIVETIQFQNAKRGIHTVLILILGTKNHDADQLRLFYPYLKDKEVDLRIVETIQFQYINGCRVLCIPELYNVTDDEYSKVLYESGAYDMVFMHGSIEGAIYDNKMGESKIFSPSDFSCCMGPVVAGHVHTGPAVHGFCYYNGSPIRWNFGEEETKGFQLVLYDMDTRYYYIHKEPVHSFRYDTISIDDIIMTDPQKVISYINDLREKEGIDYIRLKCVSNYDTQDALNIIKEYYRTDKTVKFKFDKEMSPDEKSFDQQTVEMYDKYSYLFDKSMSTYEIFARFINDNQSDIIVTADDIIDALKEI